MTQQERAEIIRKLDENRLKQDRRQAAQWAAQVTTPDAIRARIDYIARTAARGYLSEYTAAVYLEALTDALIKAYRQQEGGPTA